MARLRYLPLSLLVVGTLMAAPPADAQFRKGLKTISITLQRKQPPKVYLMGTAIKVQGDAESSQHQQLASRLAVMLETELASHDPRLKPVKDQAETAISVTIARLSSTRRTETRTVSVYKKTGTKSVYNEKSKKYEQQDVFGTVEERQTFVVVNGDAVVAFQTRDVKTGAVLDSDTMTPKLARDFRDGVGAPDDAAVQHQLVEATVALIVPRLAPTTQPLSVMLARPNDKVDDINKLAEKGLWSEMLDQLEQVPPFKDAEKEAYRLYNLGVVNEALAYKAEDVATSKKLLEQASVYYGRAMQGNGEEKYFREPVGRISESIAAYSTLESQVAAYSRSIAPAPKPAEPERAAARAVSEPQIFTNHDVVTLIQAGLDLPNLLESINTAPVVRFDFSTEALKDLLANKVPNPIITAMRTRQARGTATTATVTADAPIPTSTTGTEARKPNAAATPSTNTPSATPPAARPGGTRPAPAPAKP